MPRMRRGLFGMLVALSFVLVACSSETTASTTTTTTATPPLPSVSSTRLEVTTTTPSRDDGPDTILFNGQVVTVDAIFSLAEALAIEDGRIVAVGAASDIADLATDRTEMIDLEGRTVMPGIVETHSHFMQFVAPDTGAMQAGHDTLVSWGVTTAGMPSVLSDQLPAFEELDSLGQIRLRAQLYLAYNSVCGDQLGDFYLSQPFDAQPRSGVAVRGVKIFSDGGVCRAPAISFEYGADAPQELQDAGWVGNGDLYVTPEEVTSVVEAVDAAGGATVIHAIGDRAIATVLEGLRDAGELGQPHQVHHNSLSSLVDPEVLEVYGDLGLIPVLQLMPWANACDPDKSDLWRSLLPDPAFGLIERRVAMSEANPGLLYAWHGDGPFVPGSPWEQLFSAVQPGYVQDGEVCFPDAWADYPSVSIEDALRMATINAARAMGLDDDLGSIEKGKLADLVILENDPLGEDPEIALARNRALATFIEGEMVFCVEICFGPEPDLGTESMIHVNSDGSCAPLEPALWWRADGSAEDEVRAAGGVGVGSLGYVPGVVGEAWSFAGDGGIALATQPSLDSGFTFEAWVRFNSGGFDEYQNIFNNSQVFVRKNNAQEGNGIAVFVTLADQSVEGRAQTSTVVPGVWYHIAATWDGADLVVFLNGAQSAVSDRPGSLTADAVTAHFGQGEAAGTEGVFLRGALDEAAFYDRPLSQTEVAEIFDAGSAGKCKG